MKRKVAVIGHGLMGRGIILSCATHGIEVVAIKRRVDDERLNEYIAHEKNKGKLTEEEYKEVMSNIHITCEINEVKNCELVIESINENLEMKKQVFTHLIEICPPDTILVSNTSSISIGDIAVDRLDKIAGMHFMSPVPVMKLVEIVKTNKTSDKTIEYVCNIARLINKIPIVVNDFPGFVVSRLVAVLVNEAASICMEGVANKEDIDTIAKLGMNLPIGPLSLADEVGIDIAVNVIDTMYKAFNNERYIVCPQLRKMKDDGNLGRKSGKGYYTYN
ncbi:MAG: 3-hydroxyacyl-CoA dehydrogenase family protein [Lachnospiraceae bacterium]|nr:3-hydroxyacyl-CoA dehydrogenase family protein [Lachnospiraceae bacterium]